MTAAVEVRCLDAYGRKDGGGLIRFGVYDDAGDSLYLHVENRVANDTATVHLSRLAVDDLACALSTLLNDPKPMFFDIGTRRGHRVWLRRSEIGTLLGGMDGLVEVEVPGVGSGAQVALDSYGLRRLHGAVGCLALIGDPR